MKMQNKLRKSYTDRAISGVCGGIAEFFCISLLSE
ncbi:PspC domain-containing protein [Paraliobacillus sp. JSM ZJ581]